MREYLTAAEARVLSCPERSFYYIMTAIDGRAREKDGGIYHKNCFFSVEQIGEEEKAKLEGLGYMVEEWKNFGHPSIKVSW